MGRTAWRDFNCTCTFVTAIYVQRSCWSRYLCYCAILHHSAGFHYEMVCEEAIIRKTDFYTCYNLSNTEYIGQLFLSKFVYKCILQKNILFLLKKKTSPYYKMR